MSDPERLARIESRVEGAVALLRLDSPPVNAVGLELLAKLRAALRAAIEDPRVDGIVLTGGRDHFSAGADVGLFARIERPEDAVEISRAFQEPLEELEDSPKPVVAALAGDVMGYALELALACHWRVAPERARFAFPEIGLGINPGGGGTQRLPRLIGARRALELLLTAERLSAPGALGLGLLDALAPPGDPVAAARSLLGTRPPPRRTRELELKTRERAAREAAYTRARELLRGRRPEYIAGEKILEAVRAGLEESFEEGLRRERDGFAECMETAATRNEIYLFFATREAGKPPPPVGAGPKIAAKSARPTRSALAPPRRAAVIGLGSMGSGIARALAASGIEVAGRDEDPAAVARAERSIREGVERRVARGRLSRARADDLLGRISLSRDWAPLEGAELMIEAVVEEAEVKRAVLERAEAVAAPGAIVATNTSTISLDELARPLARPERLIGLHFFNPAHRMPLLEVVRRPSTPEEVVARALRLARELRKTPVLVSNRVGFLVNRIFIPYLVEAFRLLEEGAEAEAIDRAMTEFGFPMGPLALIDMAGIDILAATERVLRAAFPEHGPLPEVVSRLVAQGRLGQKSGSGVYRYEPGDVTPRRSEATDRILGEVRRETARTQRAIDEDEIRRRLVLRMVSEAFRALEEGIVRRECDIDVATVLGIGFPRFRGGVLRHARDVGRRRVLSDLEELAIMAGERFSPCRRLREREGDHGWPLAPNERAWNRPRS